MRVCSTCGIGKTIDNYYVSDKHADGYWVRCKDCHHALTKKYRETRKAEIYARDQEWRKANPEKIREYNRRSKERNPEGLAENTRRWQRNNPDRVREFSHRRRTRKKNNGIYKITQRELDRLYASPCAYCGSRENITLDHVVPISKGGTHGVGNIVPACRFCNFSKRDRLLIEWRIWKSRGR